MKVVGKAAGLALAGSLALAPVAAAQPDFDLYPTTEAEAPSAPSYEEPSGPSYDAAGPSYDSPPQMPEMPSYEEPLGPAYEPEPEPYVPEPEPEPYMPEPEPEVIAPEPEPEVIAPEPEPEPEVIAPEPGRTMLRTGASSRAGTGARSSGSRTRTGFEAAGHCG